MNDLKNFNFSRETGHESPDKSLHGKTIWVFSKGAGDEGGVQRYGSEVAAAYARMGARVNVFQFGGRECEMLRSKATLHGIKSYKFKNGVNGYLPYFVYGKNRVLGEEVDLIHFTSWRLINRRNWRLTKWVPTILTVHGRDIYLSAKERSYSSIEKWGRELQRIVAVSEFSKRYFSEKYPGFAGRCIRSYNGAELSETFDGETRRPNNCVTFFNVSRQVERKNIIGALHAFAELDKRISNGSVACKEIKFIIAGLGPMLSPAKELTRKLGLEKKVKFRGFVSDQELKRCFEIADAFVHPQTCDLVNGDFEGFGLVIADAMIAGAVPIVGDNGGAAELVEHGRTGFRVDPMDTSSIADAMQKIVQDDQAILSMRQRARRHALENFSWDKHVLSACERLII